MTKINIDSILPNPDQPRTDFDQDELMILSESIREFGLITAITAEKVGDSYILIDGERRWKAAKMAGLKKIHALVIYPPPLKPGDHTNRLERAMVANIQRSDIDPIDEAKAYQRLKDERGLSINKIAKLIGVSQPRVDGRLQLLELDEPIQALVAAGKLQKDIRVSRALLAIPDKQARIKLAERLAYPGITISLVVSASKKLADRLNGEPKEIIEESPAVYYGRKRAKGPVEIPIYVRLRDNGRLPSWDLFTESAKKTCKACSIYDHATELVCKECPAVQLITEVVDLTIRLKQ